MKQHCTDRDLELLAAFPNQLGKRAQAKVRGHIRKCAFCKERLDTLRAFHAEVKYRFEKAPSEKDSALADSLLYPFFSKLLPFRGLEKQERGGSVNIYAKVLQPTAVDSIIRYTRAHPARVASGGILAAAIVLATFQIARKATDTNPAYVEIKNSVLTTYNRVGTPLWEKNARDMPNGTSKEAFFSPLGSVIPQQIVLVDDIDGNGVNEVILTSPLIGNNLKPSFAEDSLYCFNGDGTLRWRSSFPENRFNQTFPYTRWSTWKPSIFFVLVDNLGRQRLFVTANCKVYFPSKLMEINSVNGQVLQTYWHPGNINFAFANEAESKERHIVIAGINNGHKRAFGAILDPDHLNGSGPATPDFSPAGIEKGKEKSYMLFPRSDIAQRFGKIPYNVLAELKTGSEGSLIAHVNDFAGSTDLEGNLIYTLGSDLRVLSVTWSDMFLKTYGRLLADGKVSEPLSPAYWEKLKNSAVYWDGEKFVNEPVMNKYYEMAKKLP